MVNDPSKSSDVELILVPKDEHQVSNLLEAINKFNTLNPDEDLSDESDEEDIMYTKDYFDRLEQEEQEAKNVKK